MTTERRCFTLDKTAPAKPRGRRRDYSFLLRVAAIAALIFGIAFTIIFSEGITAFGKFLSQKVKEVKKVAEELSPEMQAALAEFLAAKKAAEVPAEEVPKE